MNIVDMRTFTLEISKPRDPEDFEDFCADIYSVVYSDPAPKRNGRSGQAQGGVDIFIEPPKCKRKAIQCKRYYETKVAEKLIDTEIRAADKAGWNIGELVIATTTASDSTLVRYAQDISDIRVLDGKFKVSIEFWSDICNHINRHSILQRNYSPNAPGGVFDDVKSSLRENQAQTVNTAEMVGALQAQLSSIVSQIGAASLLPQTTSGTVLSVFSRQLDKAAEFVKAMSYGSAQGLLSVIASELENLDTHQRARWHLLSGIVEWHLGDPASAARKFDTAYDIYPNDDRVAAGKIRGLLLTDRTEQALDIANEALTRFPDSIQVWLAWANTKIKLEQYLQAGDLPVRFAEEADALQMMSVSFHESGERTLSLSYAERALRANGAGFYTWSNVLFIATDFACREAYLAGMGLMPRDVQMVLVEVSKRFEPREDNLWRFEAASTVPDTAANLAVANLLLGDASACLAICNEGEIRKAPPSKFAAARIYAYRERGDLQKVVENGQPYIDELHVSAQVMVAEAAANLGKSELVREVAALPSVQGDDEAKNTLQALLWVALRNSGDRDATLRALDTYDFETESALVILNAGARLYLTLDSDAKAGLIADRIRTLVTTQSTTPAKLQTADLMVAVGDYTTAIALLTSIPGFDESATLQTRLLAAYAYGGFRAKARQLLDSASPDRFDNDEFIRLAIVAAQQANDWHRLKPLALRHKERCRLDARAWVFWYRVALHTLKPAEIRPAFSEAPLDLTGSATQIRTLALAELQYGEMALGMRRLYRLFRCHINDSSVAAGYVTALLTAEDVPWGTTPLVISAGVAATLERDDGSSFVLTIDPPDVGSLPEGKNFFPQDSSFVASFIGKSVGDVIVVNQPFGEPMSYRVSSLMPAHRHLLNCAHQVVNTSVEPNPNFVSLPFKNKDGDFDTTQIHAQLKRMSERGKMVLDGYREGRLSVGLCAQLLGRSPVEILLGWGRGLPPLVVAEGGSDNQSRWMENLAASSACVVDCITLIELGLFKALFLLPLMPNPTVSRRAYDYLLVALDEARNERSVGQAAEIDGKFTVLRFTAEDRNRKVALLNSIVESVERHCEIVPAYGPDDVPASFLEFKDVLDDESYDAIALCLERKAALVSLDARLRALAFSGFGVAGIAPQAILAKAVTKSELAHSEYCQYLMHSLVGNRTYISIAPNDFLWMLCQAGWSTVVLDTYAEVIASSATLFDSAVGAVCAIFQSLHLVDIQFGALARVVQRLGSSIYRHPGFHASAERAMRAALQTTALRVYESPPWHPALTNILNAKARDLWSFIEAALYQAKAVADGTTREAKDDLCSLYCERRPILMGK